MLYETLLLAAVLFIAGFVFTAIFQPPLAPILRYALQLYLLLVAAAYFIWYWLHGGQTLPMKAWRIRLVGVTPRKALLRLVFAALLLPVSILWALFDRDRQFLHDRLAGTRLVLVNVAPPTTS